MEVTLFIAVRTVSVQAEIKSTPDVVIYSGTYPAWPWIAATPSGKLLCVWREGTVHGYSPTGRMMLSTSIDQGQTWATPITFQNAPNVDERSAAILPLSETEWIVSYFATDADGISRTMVTRTTDAGASWFAPVVVNPHLFSSASWAAPIRLSNGNLLLPYYGAVDNTIQSLAALSQDGGCSWTTVVVPNTSGLVGNEWSVMELPNHTLAALIRNGASGNDGSLYITKSFDMGRTWSIPEKTNLRDSSGSEWKSPAQIFLHEGKVWASYDDPRWVAVSLATTTDPNLKIWDIDNRIRAYQYNADGSRVYDAGYACSVSIGGNKRLIVDYINIPSSNGRHEIVGYYVTLPVPEPSSLTMGTAIGLALGRLYLRSKELVGPGCLLRLSKRLLH